MAEHLRVLLVRPDWLLPLVYLRLGDRALTEARSNRSAKESADGSLGVGAKTGGSDLS
jgi:hypothetical protein